MKQIFMIVVILAVAVSCSFETKVVVDTGSNEMHKLLVGITVDQMRADYLQRFSPYFSDGGFTRLVAGWFTIYTNQYGYATK